MPSPTLIKPVDTVIQSAPTIAVVPIAAPTQTTAPSPTPAAPTQSFADQMLAAINTARAQARNCGTTRYPATGPLRWNAQTEEAARIQASYLPQ